MMRNTVEAPDPNAGEEEDESFNAASLMSLDSSLGDDGEVVCLGQDELQRINSADVRRKCASLKLAARIVGIASAGHEDSDDGKVLQSMEVFVTRMSDLRKAAMLIVDIDQNSPDYVAAFNAVTGVVIDMLTEEWKWLRLNDVNNPLSVKTLGQLLNMTIQHGPKYLPPDDCDDLKTTRLLCVLETIPKLWGVANIFDYFQPQREQMVHRLVQAVSEQAETHASALYSVASPGFAVKAIMRRMYGVSTGLMCEVYKEMAVKEVAQLHSMPELERSVHLANIEQSGIKFDHIIERHRSVMNRTLDTTKLILEACFEHQESAEQNHDA